MPKLHSWTEGRGKDLVLLHGWGMNGAVWQPLLPSLATEYRVTVIELPGHGASAYPADTNSLDQWVECILSVAPPQAVWLGWSLGGQLAMQAALLAPERVSALVLVASTPRFVQDVDWPHAQPVQTFHQFGKQLISDPVTTLNRFLALQVHGTEFQQETLKQLRKMLKSQPEPSKAALNNGLQLLVDTDLRASIGELQPASLWLLGGRDALVPRQLAGELSHLLPEASIQVLGKAAHAPFLSHPGLCSQMLREFLHAD